MRAAESVRRPELFHSGLLRKGSGTRLAGAGGAEAEDRMPPAQPREVREHRALAHLHVLDSTCPRDYSCLKSFPEARM